jgi:hypothetical protein
MFIINCIFALYLFSRMNKMNNAGPSDPDRVNNVSTEAARREQYEKGKQFFLYDPLVALFILLGIFQIVWAVMGLTYANDSSSDFCDTELNEHTIVLTTKITAIGYLVWIPLGMLIVMLPFMTAFCSEIADDCGCDECCLCLVCWPVYIPYLLCFKYSNNNESYRRRRATEQQNLAGNYQGPQQGGIGSSLNTASAAVGAAVGAVVGGLFGSNKQQTQQQQHQQQHQQQPQHAVNIPVGQQQVPYGQQQHVQVQPQQHVQYAQPVAPPSSGVGQYPPPSTQQMQVQPSAPPAYDDGSHAADASPPSKPQAAPTPASSQPEYGSQPAYGAPPKAPEQTAASKAADNLKSGFGKAKNMFKKK